MDVRAGLHGGRNREGDTMITFTVDTREPWPHPYAEHFSEDVRLVRATMETGDLCVSVLPDGVCAERKAVGDLLSCLGQGRDRFQNELKRGRLLGRLVVVCDGSMADLLCEARRRGGGMSDASIIGTLAAWQRRYAPFFFAGSVRVAAEFTERLLRGQIAEAQRTAKAVAKAEGRRTMSTKPKTVAEEALGSLLTMPMPKTERHFRRAVIMAALIGRQIEADFAEHPDEHVSTLAGFDSSKSRPGTIRRLHGGCRRHSSVHV